MEQYPTVQKMLLQQNLRYEDQVLLTYQIAYPVFRSSRYQLALYLVNRLNEKNAKQYQKHLEEDVFPLAVEQYQAREPGEEPFPAWDALQEYQVTDLTGCIISLYFDRYEYTGGAHGNTVRTSQSWNLQKCERVRLRDLIHCSSDYQEYVMEQVIHQIEKNPSIYFDDYKKLVRDTFRPENFYCTPKGVTVYFQQYDIAPYSSGIQEFLLPYSCCVLRPESTCFVSQ